MPSTLDCPPRFTNPFRSVTNNLIIFAAPFAIKPNVINIAGPIRPTMPINFTIPPFTPSLSPLNFSSILPINSTIGVTAFKNCSPIGANVNLRSSIDFLNFVPVASSTFLSSRSDKIASSCTEAPDNFNVLDACVPSLVMF